MGKAGVVPCRRAARLRSVPALARRSLRRKRVILVRVAIGLSGFETAD